MEWSVDKEIKKIQNISGTFGFALHFAISAFKLWYKCMPQMLLTEFMLYLTQIILEIWKYLDITDECYNDECMKIQHLMKL